MDLLISVRNTTDTLRIQDQFLGLDNQIEYFKFYDNSDGTPDYLTANDVAQLLQVAAGNIGDNVIQGLPDQPNVLDGGPGDDTLIGGAAADTYVFSTGYGFDRIVEQPDAPEVNDQVVFGASVQRDTLKFSRNGTDLKIDLGNGADVLTIADGLGTHSVEKYLFADGSTMTLDDVKSELLVGTDGDDQLIGFDNRNDTSMAARAPTPCWVAAATTAICSASATVRTAFSIRREMTR
jgi:Haemolysin-type calcium binding protein related domain.